MTILSRVLDPGQADDLNRIQSLALRLTSLAMRIESGAVPNPTELLCIRSTKLSRRVRLQYRAKWIENLIHRRRDVDSFKQIELLHTARLLILTRKNDPVGLDLAKNRRDGSHLADQIRHLQPGWRRLSHYCSRRVGPDVEMLAVEFFASGLDFPYINGEKDYMAAIYCICRQPDLRFRFDLDAAPRIRQLAADWAEALNVTDVAVSV